MLRPKRRGPFLSTRRPPPSFVLLSGSRRLPRRHEPVLARTDEIRAPHALQRLAQHRPVVRIVIAQERLVQSTHA